MKTFFTNPITITVGIILSLGILALVGYNYWGWFGSSQSNNSNSNIGGTTGDRIMNFNSNIIGLSDASSEERKQTPAPRGNPFGYLLCYTRVAILNKGSEDLITWQTMVSNTLQNIRDNAQKAKMMGYPIAVIITAPQIVVGAKVVFYVYAADCNSAIAKEFINYIQNLH